jgi:hypothetical protein
LAVIGAGGVVALFTFLLKRFERVFAELAEIKAAVSGTPDRPGIAADVKELKITVSAHDRVLRDHEGRLVSVEGRME